MQTQPAFDTHAFVKRLTRAGMPEDQAEVLANGQSDLYERLVTKEHFEFTLTHELEKLRAELKHDIEKGQANLEKLRAELKHDIETLRAELKHDIDKVQANLETVRAELEITKTELKRDIKEMEQKLTIKLGAFLGISVTILAALIKFF